MSDATPELVPSTDILRQECPRLRILVVGKSGVGKSALINAVFGLNATDVTHNKPGAHDIDKPLTYSSNDQIIIHDSQGFETGEDKNLRKVTEFIDRRRNASSLAERLHAIWVCAQIPFSGTRLFEKGVELILQKYWSTDLPVIVVFTKLDLLHLHIRTKFARKFSSLEANETRERIDEIVEQEIRTQCVQPLLALTPGDSSRFPWVVTSTRNKPQFKQTIKELVDRTLSSITLEAVWMQLAIAQRSNAQANIEACTRIGRKRLSMKGLIDVLHQDIVAVWNMEDPNRHLLKPEFLALLSILVEDLSDESGNDLDSRSTERAVEGAPRNSRSLVISGPAAAIIFFAEWVRRTYNKTKSSLRCMVAYIVDLTLTMDTLFYLTLSQSLSVKLINRALLLYKARKAPVHASIRAWADRWGTFSHLDADSAINRVRDILLEHSIKPEDWAKSKEDMDEAWISVDMLRTS